LPTRFRERIEFSRAALVFSGGAAKAAAFHVGVCLALRDKGFSFVGGRAERPVPPNCLPYPRPRYHPHQIATYVGSSAGALVVTMLASGVSIEAILNSFADAPELRTTTANRELPRIGYRDMLKLAIPKTSSILKNFRRVSLLGSTLESMVLKNVRLPGIFTTRGLVEYLKRNVLPTDYFHELKANLFIVGTQLDHSRKIVFGRYGTEKAFDTYAQYASNARISDAVGASMSVPLIYTPYLIEHDGGRERYYFDGEIRETLSTHVAKENDCDLLICSYTHQPYHYDESIGSLYHYGLASVVVQAIYQAIEQKIYGARKAHDHKVATVRIVREFFQERRYPQEDLAELVAKLEARLDFKEKLRYVFIHPEPRDREMFFGDHFTLNPRVLQNVVMIGYKRAMSELRKYELVPNT
jgi:predicted acylesterase/phospholipase RssA